MKAYIEKIFEVIFDGCTFGSVEDDYLIHYSQPCVIMDGSWVESEVNVYEFANECKEWAISKGYITHSIRNLKEYVVYISGDRKEHSDDFRAKTEPEAIFLACDWLLKNKDKQ